MDHQAVAQLLGNYGEFIGAIAVVVTLGYLAVQIRQNSSSVKSAAAQSVLSNITTALQTVSETPQMSRVIYVGMGDFDALSEEERYQFFSWLLSWFRVMEQAHYHYRLGNLDAALFAGHVEHLRSTFECESIENWWDLRRALFSKEFQEFVGELQARDSVTVSAAGLLGEMSR